jgi:elongation factor 1-gamma
LQGKEFLVGGHLTVADVIVSIALLNPLQTVLDAGFRKAMTNFTNWATKLFSLPEFVARLGHTKFAAKAIKPVLEEKKKEEPAPKHAAAKKDTEGHDDEEGEKKKEKEKDLRDEPSKFDLYNFKTFFVNSKDRRGEGMKAFFEQYVKEDFCIYFVHYEKYEGEGTVLYQTSNLLNGFLQRIDHFRKHTLAMHAILGEEPNLEIQGVWLFRGKGIPPEMKDHP